MVTIDYWNKRVEKYGHTGHSEPFYYCFDQQARLFAVDAILKALNTKLDAILDFGCGSGDFLELLSHYSKKVYGFDPSENVVKLAQKTYKDRPFLITNDLQNCAVKNGFNCILSVTVLQSLTVEQLEITLPKLTGLLAEGAKMICMEFFVNDTYQQEKDEFKTSERQWLNLLDKYNIKVVDTQGFYNPVVFPGKSWKRYQSSLIPNLLKPLKKFRFAQTCLSAIAKKLIQEEKDVFPYPASSFKIFILEKRT